MYLRHEFFGLTVAALAPTPLDMKIFRYGGGHFIAANAVLVILESVYLLRLSSSKSGANRM